MYVCICMYTCFYSDDHHQALPSMRYVSICVYVRVYIYIYIYMVPYMYFYVS